MASDISAFFRSKSDKLSPGQRSMINNLSKVPKPHTYVKPLTRSHKATTQPHKELFTPMTDEEWWNSSFYIRSKSFGFDTNGKKK